MLRSWNSLTWDDIQQAKPDKINAVLELMKKFREKEQWEDLFEHDVTCEILEYMLELQRVLDLDPHHDKDVFDKLNNSILDCFSSITDITERNLQVLKALPNDARQRILALKYVDKGERNGETAFHILMHRPNKKLIEQIMEWDIGLLTAPRNDGNTPLHLLAGNILKIGWFDEYDWTFDFLTAAYTRAYVDVFNDREETPFCLFCRTISEYDSVGFEINRTRPEHLYKRYDVYIDVNKYIASFLKLEADADRKNLAGKSPHDYLDMFNDKKAKAALPKTVQTTPIQQVPEKEEMKSVTASRRSSSTTELLEQLVSLCEKNPSLMTDPEFSGRMRLIHQWGSSLFSMSNTMGTAQSATSKSDVRPYSRRP